MPEPDAGAYREALKLARRRIQALDRRMGREIVRALERWAEELRQALTAELGFQRPGRLTASALKRVEFLEATERVVRDASLRLYRRLEAATLQGRGLAFEELLAVWQEAGREAAQSAGVSLAALGRVRVPPVTMLGVFEALGAAPTWRTLLRGHVEGAAREATAIFRRAFLEGIGPDEAARRLRRYVVGSEQLDDLFESVKTLSGEVKRIDLRQAIPRDARKAAAQMKHNAERIAFTEFQNARAEAEVQHFMRDPVVQAIKREFSPNRGSQVAPDACDVLNTNDHYGMGPGVYPVDRVPPEPHPFGRCEFMPVLFQASEIGSEKPSPPRQLNTERFTVPRRSKITDRAFDRAVEEAEGAIAFAETAIRRAA